MIRWLAAILIFLMTPVGVRSAVVVNEVMANEPGSSTTLEWIELYNTSGTAVSLDAFFQLEIGGSTITLLGSIPGRGYFIVCRRLFTGTGSIGFEEQWGNNSGVWGDDPRENYAQPFETGFSLANGSGAVVMVTAGNDDSSFVWSSAGLDGYSWERQLPTGNVIGQSVDPSGSTPGRVNSLFLFDHDLSLDSVNVAGDRGATVMAFFIRNAGRLAQTGRTLTVSLAGLDADTLLFADSLPPSDTGIVTLVQRVANLPGMYHDIVATLDDDDRQSNNVREFVAPGGLFPAVELSELLVNPPAEIGTEWIELRSTLDTAFEMTGWQVGDGQGLAAISSGPVMFGPGGRIVLAEDSAQFRIAYPGFTGTLVEPATWRALNDGADTVRLVDHFGLEADREAYQHVLTGGYTLCRGETEQRRYDWGYSVDIYGTPGTTNVVQFDPTGSSVRLSISPELFSPDGDGVDEIATIRVIAPAASGYHLKIYDRQGRLVHTILDHEPYLQDEYQWDGRTDSGRRLPIGVYIVYFEAKGVESIKTTVVIAR